MLEKAVLHTVTHSDDGKNKETTFDVTVRNLNSKVILRASGLGEHIQYVEGQTPEDITLSPATGAKVETVSKAECSCFSVEIVQYTTGSDTWGFNPTLTLYFKDDQETMVATTTGVRLVDNRASCHFCSIDTFAPPAAELPHPSAPPPDTINDILSARFEFARNRLMVSSEEPPVLGGTIGTTPIPL